MKRNYLLRGLALMLAVFGVSSACRAADGCESTKMPREISAILQTSFRHWRVEQTSDLNLSSREAWTKKYPGACAGFVVGHFRRTDSVEYALLLLPADETVRGYRVVVVLESAKGRWHPIVLEKGDQNTPATAVIGLAEPGEYREAEGNKKIHTQTDAIFSEDIGVGVLIYYWQRDRFQSLVISD